MVAWNGSGPGLLNLASDSDSFEAFLPREPHGVALGIAALMAAATPTPTPNPTGVGCHRWRYALRFEQPSRLAILKNVLGNSVTTNTGYKAPGAGNQNDWPDPITHSASGQWNYLSPPLPTVGTYNHDCGGPLGPACAPPTPTDVEGEQPGIYYSKGTWDWPDPNSDFLVPVYDPAYPPLYRPGVDTTNACKYEDIAIPPASVNCGGVWGYGTAGTYDAWAWTLNYGYGPAPINDIVYGPDPGPPLALMDETPVGDSIPGQTGTPFSFPTAWTTRGGAIIGVQTVIPKPTDPNVIQYAGLHQPSWTQNAHRDVVGSTKDQVNWGLMTFNFECSPQPCSPISTYNPLVNVVTIDTGPGDVTAIEGYMRLNYFNSPPYPGLGANGGTPTVGAIGAADSSLATTWHADPKQACNRAYGVILCTDGQSNITNTGNPADTEWDLTTPLSPLLPGQTPCSVDVNGVAFTNFPPGAAEATYLNAHQRVLGSTDAIIRARTFAIGISTDISRCELNRTAYRGRTDANAKKKDAGFVLYDVGDPLVLRGDIRLPHINPSPETAGTTVPTDESGPGLPPAPNRYTPDKPVPTAADLLDYAFFANDARALYDAFLAIVRGSASGDYTTSSPVSGAAVSLGDTVVLTSATYPLWHGHIYAKDTSGASASPPTPIVNLWDAGAVLSCATGSSTDNVCVLTPPTIQAWDPTPDGTAGHPRRQLYTWDPATGALIEIVAGNAGIIDALCGGCGITTAGPAQTPPLGPGSVIDFMRGNDGTETSTARNWLLGPSVNVTPAIVGAAQAYYQGSVVAHQSFEGAYATRRNLAWLGADDGFLHAFDLGDVKNPGDGAEVIGLLPPNLIANQITLYNTFLDTDPQITTDTGQNAGYLFDEHTWGVASSLRFADVYFGAPTNAYKTVGFLTEGPGGDLVAAIDITHPYPGRASAPAVPADNNYGLGFAALNAGKPVDVLWTKNAGAVPDYAGLYGTWSVPAVANDTFTTSKMTFGAGINPASLYTAQQPADIFVVDPTTGALLSTTAIAPLASPSPLVGHQTFTDSIFFQTNAPGFQNDNVANLSLQGDENGRVNALFGNWASPTSAVLIDLNAAAKAALGTDSPQPLYYSPAANGIGTLGFQVYALASGSFYETSPAVSGWNVNRVGAPPVSTPPSPSDYPSTLPVFVPTLFVATNPLRITDAGFASVPLGSGAMAPHVISKVIGGETTGIPLQLTDPTYIAGVHTRLGIHSQVTSSPLLVGNATSTTQDVFFTVFDPDYGCNGYSYVIEVHFTISGSAVPTFVPNAAGCASTVPPSCGTTVYAAAAGASSGFVVTKDAAFVGQSGVGKATATLVEVNIPKPSLPGQPNFRPLWWKEQR